MVFYMKCFEPIALIQRKIKKQVVNIMETCYDNVNLCN